MTLFCWAVQDCDKVESNSSSFTSKTKPFTKIYYTLQSKHPHIIYESIEKPRQLCGVSDSVLRNPNSRSRRSADDIHDMFHSHNDNNNHSRHQRDVRYVPKFVETALVLDKAMVWWENKKYFCFYTEHFSLTTDLVYQGEMLFTSQYKWPTLLIW